MPYGFNEDKSMFDLDALAAARHAHDAEDIATGELDMERIPSLAAAKIGSGTLDMERLPFAAGTVTFTTTSSYRVESKIYFGKTFKEPPIIIVSPVFSDANDNKTNAQWLKGLTVVVAAVTTTNATLRLFNELAARGHDYTYNWIAIGAVE